MIPEVLSPDYIFTFGKHKGRRLSEVDTRYIQWCISEINWFRDAYNRMVSDQLNTGVNENEEINSTLEQRTVDRIQNSETINSDIKQAMNVKIKTVYEVDLGWFNRTGGDFNKRGRV